MGTLLYFLLLIFVASTEAIKPKSVNIALETVMEFNDKDNSADLNFLDNLQLFLDKIKRAVDNKSNARRSGREINIFKFTDFLISAIRIVQTYEDDDLEDVFSVFDEEIRKYHYKGCRFYELVEDRDVRRSVANNLVYLKHKPASQLRKILNYALQSIEDAKFTTVHSELLEYVNSLYRHEANNKLHAFLNKLEAYSSKSKRANLDLVKVIRDGIRSTIFDHYSELTPNARRELKVKIATSWKADDGKVNYKYWTLEITKMGKHNTMSSKPIDYHVKRSKKNKKVSKKSQKNKKEELSVSDISDLDFSETTPRYKKKSKHDKRIEYKKELKVTNALYVKPIKHKSSHKKLFSFITLYPEEIILTKIKDKTESATTQKSKLHTLREEKKKETPKTNKKHKPKSDVYYRGQPIKEVITEYDTVINVQANLDSTDEEQKENRDIKTKEKRHKTNSTGSKPNKTFYRRTPTITSVSDEGLSIEENMKGKTKSVKANKTEDNTANKQNDIIKTTSIEKDKEEEKTKTTTKQTPAVVLVTRYDDLVFGEDTTVTKQPTTKKTTTKLTTQTTKPTITTSTTKSQTNGTTTIKTTTKPTNNTLKAVANTISTITTTRKQTTYTKAKPEERLAQKPNRKISMRSLSNLEDDKAINERLAQKPNRKIPMRSLINLDDDKDLAINVDTDINNILKKYNVTTNSVTKKHFNFGKMLADSGKSFNDTKNILEDDFFGTTQGLNFGNDTFMDDPLLDINFLGE